MKWSKSAKEWKRNLRMGIEYNLVKIRNGETYELGKESGREPVGGIEKAMKKVARINMKENLKRMLHLKRMLQGDYDQRDRILNPSRYHMWEIGSDTGNCALFRMPDRWTVEKLAEKINQACFLQDDNDHAMRIASDIFQWAGDDEIVLVPDNIFYEEIAEKLGVPVMKDESLKKTGSIYKVI